MTTQNLTKIEKEKVHFIYFSDTKRNKRSNYRIYGY